MSTNGKIDRIDCDSVAYGYFHPNRTPNILDFDDAAVRLATFLNDRNKDTGGKARESIKKSLPTELYILALEKLADGDV